MTLPGQGPEGSDTPVRGRFLRIDVDGPIKTADRYEFHYELSAAHFTKPRAAHFGFRALNFSIAHNEVWDSVFPLMFLTRNGGPLFRRAYNTAVIRFRFPVLESVCQLFVQRAANFGLFIEVEADTIDRTYDISGNGNILAFGGGKESRLLFGLLRELGQTPRVTMGSSAGDEDIVDIGQELKRAADLPSVEVSKPFRDALVERLMPGLMAGAANFYFGSSLVDVHLAHPWHQHYDLASWQGQNELNELFRSLGVDLRIHAPLSGLPSNIIQKILAVRYPDLYAHQWSVESDSVKEKNLHVSLLKLYHDIPIASQCSEELFRRLLRDFVASKLSDPLDFGFHNVREIVQREIMAMIWKRRDHRLLDEVRAQVPPDWDASWIDFLHTYVNPDLDPALQEIFRQYAKDYVPAPGEYVFPTPAVPCQAAEAPQAPRVNDRILSQT